jgi:hypothetical protein
MGARRGTLALVAADGSAPVSPGAVLVEEMLAGWRRQQQARRLTARLTGDRERVVRQFGEFTGVLAVAVDSGAGRGVAGVGRVGAFDGPFLSGSAGAVPGVRVRSPVRVGQ